MYPSFRSDKRVSLSLGSDESPKITAPSLLNLDLTKVISIGVAAATKAVASKRVRILNRG
jgi:hypothetical protein